jgi:ABC-type glutathione transport system ATPase component
MLVTHDLEIAKRADVIIVLDSGRIVQQGTHAVLANNEGIYQTLLKEHGHTTSTPANVPAVLSMTMNEEDDDQNPEIENPKGVSHSSDRAATKLHIDEEINIPVLSPARLSSHSSRRFIKVVPSSSPSPEP